MSEKQGGEKTARGQSAVLNAVEMEEDKRKRGRAIGYPEKGIGDLGEGAASWKHGAF